MNVFGNRFLGHNPPPQSDFEMEVREAVLDGNKIEDSGAGELFVEIPDGDQLVYAAIIGPTAPARLRELARIVEGK